MGSKLKAADHTLVQLRRARDHADRHFAQPLDLAQLASVAALSRYHFHRLFTATYGITPAAYLSERRIERAQDLLRATNLTVTEVCFAVGFSSLGSFSTRFREVVGEAPSEFQRRYVADCHQTYEDLVAKGVEFIQEPADRPYGIEALMRDNSGNWIVLVEPREFSPADMVGFEFG